MKNNNRRVPMFLKFWLGCSILAALLIIGAYLVVRAETKMKSRGDYLAKHFKRYEQYQAGLGQAVSSVANVLASDSDLIRALSTSPPTKVPDAESGVPSETVASIAPQDVAKSIYSRISGKQSIAPDMFVVFSKNELVWSAPKMAITADELQELEPVARIRGGQAFFNKVLILRGQALQIAGLPIRDLSGDLIGGLIVGVHVERYMKQYQVQSDKRKRMQHQLSMVYDNKVVASVMPKELWPTLNKKLQEGEWGHEQEGNYNRAIVHLPGDDYDFTQGQVAGFAGVDSGNIASLFLLRSRSNLVGRGPKLPWIEIIIGAILSLLIASGLAFWITRPIKHFVIQSRKMLEGKSDLNQRIEIASNDEVADLADNINAVFARLYRLANDVQSAAFHVGASSAEISAASKNMLGGLQDQTFKIQSSTAAVTELSASIQQVAENANDAAQVAGQTNSAVGEAVERMQQIQGAVEKASNKMDDLGESSKRIGNIVEVIRQISEQTSLLALNASIEAAHAGEQGRGFAVVADEVSSLARRVGQSAKDIESLIQTVKEQTSDAISSMEVGTREVKSGTVLVTNTLQNLGVLIATVNDTATAVQEQAEVSDEIARNMDAVQLIASELVTGSQEAVQQGEQLHGLAFELERSVGGFNLDPSGDTTPAALTDGEN